jgi:BlaI family transcriptional regulator, penicillinase repressor
MPPLPKPADAELALLRLLWDGGPATVRQLHEALNQHRSLSYTTTLTTLLVMLDKGLVTRDASQRSHIYRAAVAEAETKGLLVADLMTKAFSGSAHQLMVHALTAGKTSEAELDAIQDLIDSMRKGRP